MFLDNNTYWLLVVCYACCTFLSALITAITCFINEGITGTSKFTRTIVVNGRLFAIRTGMRIDGGDVYTLGDAPGNETYADDK